MGCFKDTSLLSCCLPGGGVGGLCTLPENSSGPANSPSLKPECLYCHCWAVNTKQAWLSWVCVRASTCVCICMQWLRQKGRNNTFISSVGGLQPASLYTAHYLYEIENFDKRCLINVRKENSKICFRSFKRAHSRTMRHLGNAPCHPFKLGLLFLPPIFVVSVMEKGCPFLLPITVLFLGREGHCSSIGDAHTLFDASSRLFQVLFLKGT